jgi:hypothetical protein
MEPQKGRFLATTANMCESLIQVNYIEALITIVKCFMEHAEGVSQN